MSSATIADLKKLIYQATPRVEDVRSVDRCDIIRRDRGHMNLREVLNSVNALEFSVDSFARCMKEVRKEAAAATTESSAEESKAESNAGGTTAVDGLFQAIEGLSLLSPQGASQSGAEADASKGPTLYQPTAFTNDGWQDAAAEAKKAGGDSFKSKEFATALTHYNAAVAATPEGDETLTALFSNRSACLLQLGHCSASLADAQRCTTLAPEWPKGHFRVGCTLRQLDRLEEATAAFRQGQVLEPANKDWEREVEKTELQHLALPSTQVRQLVWHLLPELLQVWVRAGASGGVVQVQVNGELADVGSPKWLFARERKEAAKAQLRFAIVNEKGYMANLTASLVQTPPAEGVAIVDLNSKPLKISDIKSFVSVGEAAADSSMAFQLDVKHGGKMVAIIGRVQVNEEVKKYLPPHKDPQAPKGSVEGALQAQARTGFANVLPRYLGFQSYPGGDLNFPVIDLERDCPGATPVVKA
jgi:tetratricopeptide (TPR) repeat protein